MSLIRKHTTRFRPAELSARRTQPRSQPGHDSGNGIVIMTNSDVGLNAGNPLLDRIAQVYGWNYAVPPLPF